MQLKNRIARYLGVVLPCTLILAAAPANAELYQFSYTFEDGSQLSGFLEGTPVDTDRVLITGFGAVRLNLSSGSVHDFASIEANEINTFRDDGRSPMVTFSGDEIAFRVCPNGFSADNDYADGILDDCNFGSESGFTVETHFDNATFGFWQGFVDTNYGGVSPLTTLGYAGPGDGAGGRAGDFPPPISDNWQLTLVNAAVDPTVDLDPTVTLGDNTTLDKDVAVEENVSVGDNVTLDKGSSIGADSAVGADTTLDQGTSIGSNVTIGANVIIDADVTILDGVVIGDNVHIGRGALICSDVEIGVAATIGKFALVVDDVTGIGAAIPKGTAQPDASDCP